MVQSNSILYAKDEHPDHVVVIKYVPYVGDSKRAMDEYTSEIMMGGHNTLVIHNTCEDSLLASPLILDLAILGELCSRIKVNAFSLSSLTRILTIVWHFHTSNLFFSFHFITTLFLLFAIKYHFLDFYKLSIQIKRNEPDADFVTFRSVLSILSYLCKAPLVPNGTPVINSLFRQRTAIENLLRACVGLPPNSHIALEHRVSY